MKYLFFSVFLLHQLFAYNQTGIKLDSLQLIDIDAICNENFSQIKKDSTFSNFYISSYKDTTFFRPSSCILSIELTSPLTFRRRTKNGWANGLLRIYQKHDSTYTWLNGEFEKGILVKGNTYEYYKNNSIRMTGQFLGGRRFGVWTWYYENGRIKRLITYGSTEPIKEIEFDQYGKTINQYDLFEEKN